MGRLKHILAVILLLSCPVFGQPKNEPGGIPTIHEKTAGMKYYPGFLAFYSEEKSGKIWLAIEKWDTEILYIESLSTGIGSNDIGLDRGQLGITKVVKFQRFGPKVLLVQSNYSFRATTGNQDEKRAVEEAFAQSVIWGFEITAEEGRNVLVDASTFFLRDAHDVAGVLRRQSQGKYDIDASRSVLYLPRTKNFPKNTEVEALLTFSSDSPGRFVGQVAPDPHAITVHEHHSFVELPDNSYTPRWFDPRSGFESITYTDFSAPLGEPLEKHFIMRHRLKKKDSAAKVSEPVEPIVYYVDRGAPEPIRTALVEGAQWWNQAFEAAGYRNAFQVRLLPEDADPMDIRYNVIQWVHRSSRGWSYGSTVCDPRTGEIIKGKVTLGSLRIRQDYRIAEGLLAPYMEGKPVSSQMEDMALARIRQLSCHEVGHTLGLAHNFASSVDNRASVMDYPPPLVKLNGDGALDLSDAYTKGIGEWDKVTIAFGYQDFRADIDEEKALNSIIDSALSKGLHFISDDDSRPQGSAHPLAHLWDIGTDAAQELLRIMDVRANAISRFSAANIPTGKPMATLEEVFVPVYFFHRYQLEAASKMLGGLYYTYAIRGDNQQVTKHISPQDQRRALDALLGTLEPEALAVPERILAIIPPHPPGYMRSRETFPARTGLTFDPMSAAESLANITVGLILQPERAARLVEYHSRDSNAPGLGEVADRLIEATWKKPRSDGYFAEIHRVVDSVTLYHFMALAADESAPEQVRALAFLKLDELKNWLLEQEKITNDENQRAHYTFAISYIKRFLDNPERIPITRPLSPPVGPPIGMTVNF